MRVLSPPKRMQPKIPISAWRYLLAFVSAIVAFGVTFILTARLFAIECHRSGRLAVPDSHAWDHRRPARHRDPHLLRRDSTPQAAIICEAIHPVAADGFVRCVGAYRPVEGEAVADIINYHRAASQSEREGDPPPMGGTAGQTIRRLVLVFILFVIAATISLYIFPSHRGNGCAQAFAQTSEP
jgi:hypothetical protein